MELPLHPEHGDWSRALDIARALQAFGWHDIASLLRGGRVEAAPSELLAATDTAPAPVRFRQSLEGLGPSFVKLGQVLSTRVDLFDETWIRELGALHNHVAGVAWDAIATQLTEALGAAPNDVFRSIDHVPLAAGSIAQVHAAQLQDGTSVIVKVRRPGIGPLIEADLRLMARLARLLEAHLPQARAFHPVELVKEFRTSLMRELDLAQECRHAERIARASAGGGLVVPRVFWTWTCERVNVQERIFGIPIDDVDSLRAAGLDPKMLARRGAAAVLGMMLRDGFFHADPHPGNVFALADTRIALIDFGMVGHLGRSRRRQIVDLLAGLVAQDEDAVTDVLLGWIRAGLETRREDLARDVTDFVGRYHGVPLGRLNFGRMLLDVTVLVRAHGLALPSDLALVIKVCLTLEGLGRRLDPDFDMAAEAAPFLRRAVRERYSAARMGKRSARALGEAVELAWSLPHDIRELLQSVRSGKAALRVESTSVRRLSERCARAANRLTMGIVIAALVVGSSITMTVHGGPLLLGLNVFGLMGFVGAVIAGIWLLVSIWKSGGGR